MAGGQGHLREGGRVPRREHDPPRLRVVFDLGDHVRELVDALPGVVRRGGRVAGAEVAPLEAVHGPEVADGAVLEPRGVEEGPRPVAVPDLDSLGRQLVGVGGAAHEPEELLDDAAPEHALGRQQREQAPAEVEAHRAAEDRQRPRARAVAAGDPVVEDLADQGQILLLRVLQSGGVRGSWGHAVGGSSLGEGGRG